MSKARDEYLKEISERHTNISRVIVLNYVEEFKQRCGEYHDLVETITIEKLKLEQQKAELIECLKYQYVTFCNFKWCKKECICDCTDKTDLKNLIKRIDNKQKTT